MTCIVGLKHEGKVWIGGDCAGVSGFDVIKRADPKVFQVGDFLIGYTTSFRMGQLLRFAFTPPALAEGQAIDRYMVVSFIGAVRQCLKDGGFARKENEQETAGSFLVGYRGHLFTIDSDYQVGESLESFAAVGCGAAYALGSLYATGPAILEAEARVRLALQAAAHFSAGVREPFTVVGR